MRAWSCWSYGPCGRWWLVAKPTSSASLACCSGCSLPLILLAQLVRGCSCLLAAGAEGLACLQLFYASAVLWRATATRAASYAGACWLLVGGGRRILNFSKPMKCNQPNHRGGGVALCCGAARVGKRGRDIQAPGAQAGSAASSRAAPQTGRIRAGGPLSEGFDLQWLAMAMGEPAVHATAEEEGDEAARPSNEASKSNAKRC